ncbi:MAG: helix-turn-helix transcriptional regulator [Firmicutes bacterium]|nr:helix-turn-helix transcriptional regulator [Bacillota bacterium]
MKQPELGKRLKEARLSRKMTQSEVVGTFITRNMLSQIESGKAMPSVETLQYLAEVLEIPLQSLISKASPLLMPELLQENDPLHDLDYAKSSLKNGDYSAVLTWKDRYPSCLEDEFYALIALASCGFAEELLSTPLDPSHHSEAVKLITKAVTVSRDAMEYSTKGFYANELVHSRALLLFNQAVQALNDLSTEHL